MFKDYKVVDILIQDERLLKNWKQLIHRLDLPVDCNPTLEKLVKKNSAQFFTYMIEVWISKHGRVASKENLSRLLFEIGFVDVAEKLGYQVHEPEYSRLRDDLSHFKVPPTILTFRGRQSETRKLKENLLGNQTPLKPTLITGIPGIGKSMLCASFLNDIKDSDAYHCIWLRGDTSSLLEEDIIEYMMPQYIGENEILGAKFYQTLVEVAKSRRIIIVIDNLNQYFPTLRPIVINKQKSNLAIIVTSLHRSILHVYPDELQLGPLLHDDAVCLLQDSLKSNYSLEETLISSQNAATICSQIGNHPLLLQYTILEILKQNQKSGEINEEKFIKNVGNWKFWKNILKENLPEEGHYNYTTSAFSSWNSCITKIQSNADFGTVELLLLKVCSWLNASEIKRKYLQDCKKLNLLLGKRMWGECVREHEDVIRTRTSLVVKLNDRKAAIQNLNDHSIIQVKGNRVHVPIILKHVTKLQNFPHQNLTTKFLDGNPELKSLICETSCANNRNNVTPLKRKKPNSQYLTTKRSKLKL